MTLEQQAEFLGYLVNRCTMSDGQIAGETHLVLDKGDVVDILAISERLMRMAPHERDIRSMVARR